MGLIDFLIEFLSMQFWTSFWYKKVIVFLELEIALQGKEKRQKVKKTTKTEKSLGCSSQETRAGDLK